MTRAEKRVVGGKYGISSINSGHQQAFTAVVQVVSPNTVPLVKLLKNLQKTKSCDQVLLIWNIKGAHALNCDM